VSGRGLLCTLASGGKLSSEKVLVTSGRIGNTEALDLAVVGVQTGERGHVIVDDDYRTTAPGVYAVHRLPAMGEAVVPGGAVGARIARSASPLALWWWTS
jgi:thioredoxin reductase